MTRVLLVRLSAMGDLTQSLGAVAALRAVQPDWQLTFVTQPEWLPLLEGVAGIDRIVAFDRRGGLPAMWRLRRELRRERYDHVLDLQGNWKSAMVTWLAGSGQRLGMAAAWRQEPRSRLLLHRLVGCEAVPHPARAAWELVKQIAPAAPFLPVRLVASEQECARVREQLSGLGVDPGRPFRLVVVTDPADPRALRPEFVAHLASDATPTVALMGPDEAGLEEPMPGATLRQGPGEIRALVALGAAIAAAGGEIVGPDQGATHVLLAAGASGRVYFGSQDPDRTASPTARVFVRERPPACQPCRQRRCSNPDGVVCMPPGPEPVRERSGHLPPIGATGAGPWPDAPS